MMHKTYPTTTFTEQIHRKKNNNNDHQKEKLQLQQQKSLFSVYDENSTTTTHISGQWYKNTDLQIQYTFTEIDQQVLKLAYAKRNRMYVCIRIRYTKHFSMICGVYIFLSLLFFIWFFVCVHFSVVDGVVFMLVCIIHTNIYFFTFPFYDKKSGKSRIYYYASLDLFNNVQLV